MKTAIEVGAAAPKSHLRNVSRAIERVLRAGYENHADQETVRQALKALSDSTKVEHVTIQNCYIHGDRTVQVDMDDPGKPVDRPASGPAIGFRPGQVRFDQDD